MTSLSRREILLWILIVILSVAFLITLITKNNSNTAQTDTFYTETETTSTSIVKEVPAENMENTSVKPSLEVDAKVKEMNDSSRVQVGKSGVSFKMPAGYPVPTVRNDMRGYEQRLIGSKIFPLKVYSSSKSSFPTISFTIYDAEGFGYSSMYEGVYYLKNGTWSFGSYTNDLKGKLLPSDSFNALRDTWGDAGAYSNIYIIPGNNGTVVIAMIAGDMNSDTGEVDEDAFFSSVVRQ